ncbi:GAF domain-containing protein, partial [Candidatus Desantisbacteria bacterium]|nr:GAF domain-containing protein [Candidatus Desantisbacteria bacterium]
MYQITLSITSFFMLFLGLFVFTRNVKSDVNRNFAVLSASLSIWGFGMLALALVKNRDDALSCLPILYIGLVFGGPALLAFTLSITENKNKINHYLVKIGYVCSCIFFLFHLMGKFGGDVTYSFGCYRSLSGEVGPYFNLFLCAIAFYSCYLLYKRYKISTSGIERNRLGYLFLGVFVAVLSSLTNILRVSGFNVYPLFHIGLLFFNAMTAYAIVRYRLMDITIIIRRALVYSVLTFLATGLWLGNVFIFSSLSTFLFGYQTFFSIGFTSGLIAFTFLPIRDKVQFWVDKAFFAQRREIEEVIHEFSLTVSSSFDREFILESMFDAISHVVEVEKIGVMIVDDTGNYSLSMSKGLSLRGIKLNPSASLINWLIQEKRSLLRREANENRDLKWARDSLLKELEEIEAVLAIPLFLHNRLIGILSLGGKTSDVGYSEEEMFLLETLATGAILAFENIRLLDNRINLMINTIDAL